MLIQKQLESKLISVLTAALSAAQLTDICRVTGSWQPAADGLVRWINDAADRAAIIHVAVGSPSRLTYSDPRNNLGVKVTLFLRYELDPSGYNLIALAEVIQSTFDRWQADTYQGAFTELDIPNFSVDDVAVDQGSSPAINGDRLAIEYPITLSGTFISPAYLNS